MAKTTKIQWCDSTVNPTMGCDGCELWQPERTDQRGDGVTEVAPSAGSGDSLVAASDLHEDVTSQLVADPASGPRRTCYAGILHGMRSKHPGFATRFEEPQLYHGRMGAAAKYAGLRGQSHPEKPWLAGMPRMIFVSDMGDALSKSISFEYLKTEIIAVANSEEGRRHVWMWLTKRPTRMAAFAKWLAEQAIVWPTNLWAGTTVTSRKTLSRLKALASVGDDATTRFVSVEPQVEHIEFGAESLKAVHLVIQGGESGKGCRPFDLAWARSLRDECHENGKAFFLKQLGGHAVENAVRLRLKDSHGGDWNEWPEDLRVREMPRARVAHPGESHKGRVVRLPIVASARTAAPWRPTSETLEREFARLAVEIGVIRAQEVLHEVERRLRHLI